MCIFLPRTGTASFGCLCSSTGKRDPCLCAMARRYGLFIRALAWPMQKARTKRSPPSLLSTFHFQGERFDKQFVTPTSLHTVKTKFRINIHGDESQQSVSITSQNKGSVKDQWSNCFHGCRLLIGTQCFSSNYPPRSHLYLSTMGWFKCENMWFLILSPTPVTLWIIFFLENVISLFSASVFCGLKFSPRDHEPGCWLVEN